MQERRLVEQALAVLPTSPGRTGGGSLELTAGYLLNRVWCMRVAERRGGVTEGKVGGSGWPRVDRQHGESRGVGMLESDGGGGYGEGGSVRRMGADEARGGGVEGPVVGLLRSSRREHGSVEVAMNRLLNKVAATADALAEDTVRQVCHEGGREGGRV